MSIAALFGGCATTPHVVPLPQAISYGGIYHTVKAGETLWSISRSYNIDLDDLLAANSIRDAGVITAGRTLIIPGAKSAERPLQGSVAKDSYDWPVKGPVLYAYGEKIDGVRNKGVDIKISSGTGVRASRPGRVVYCDSHMKGFGKTVILDHGDRYQTVYSFNSDILVKVGDSVASSDVIALAGRTGRAKEPSLHFEIRKDGKPQNPMYYLP